MKAGHPGMDRHKARAVSHSLSAEGSVAAPWMRHVAAFLIGRGLDAARLFSSAGLDIDDTLDAEARFPARQVDLLWHLSSVQANDPFIALQPGPMQPPSAFDTLAYAMMSCETLGDAVDRLLHYCTAVSDAVDLRCDRHDPGATIQVHPTEPDVPGRSLRLDYTLVTFLHFCRWLTGQPVTPLAVALPYPAPANLDVHGSAFKVTPEFSRPFHALTLSTSEPVGAASHGQCPAGAHAPVGGRAADQRTPAQCLRTGPAGKRHPPDRGGAGSPVCRGPGSVPQRPHPAAAAERAWALVQERAGRGAQENGAEVPARRGDSDRDGRRAAGIFREQHASTVRRSAGSGPRRKTFDGRHWTGPEAPRP